MEIKYRETLCGFEYGSAEVTRLHSDKKTGAVSIEIRSPKTNVQVYVTKTGKIRVWKEGAELTYQNKQ